MKRIMCLLAALLLCLWLCPALADEAEDFMTARALEMAADVAACGASDSYLALFGVSAPAAEKARAAAAALAGEAKAVFRMDIDTGAMLEAMGKDLDGIPKAGMRALRRQMPGAMLTQFINPEGIETVAAYTVLKLTESWEAPCAIPGNAVILLDFGAETALACVFSPVAAGAVSCTAYPFPWNETAQESVRTMASLGAFTLREIGLPD